MTTSFQDTNRPYVLGIKDTNTPLNGVPHAQQEMAKALTPVPTAAANVLVVVEPRSFVRNCIVSSLSGIANFAAVGVSSVREYLAHDELGSAAIVIVCAVGATASETIGELNQITAAGSTVPVVVMSDIDDGALIMSIMDSGFRGFIPTAISLDLAAHALRLVMAGGQYFPVYMLMAAKRADTQRVETSTQRIFTRRQIAVIDALRRGKANKIIAYELNMCESTVKVHVRNIMKKLNAKNRTEVAYLASDLLPSPRQ